jgi:large subunit ribosomal protein L19
MSLLEAFNQKGLSARPKVRAGDIVRVYQKDPTKEGGKPQIFEGVVIARKHGFGKTATMTVRRSTGDVAIEKIYPLHSPVIEKIEIVQRSKVHQAKLYYLRDAQGKRARLKRKNVDIDNISETKATVNQESMKDESIKDLSEEETVESTQEQDPVRETESPTEDTNKEEPSVEEKS